MTDEPGQPAVSRRELTLLALILCVAALLRGLYVAEFSAAPDFEHPFVDAGFHDNWARSIAFEDWTRPSYLPDPELESTPYLRPPGYPLFLSIVYSLFGPGYLAPRIVQGLLGVLAVFLVYRLGRSLAGPTVGLGASALLATAWVPIYFEAEFHATALLVALLLVHWNLLANWADRPEWGRALLAGLVLGLAGVVRPNVFVLAPVVLAWGGWVSARSDLTGRAAQALAFSIACLFAVAPVTLRNWRASGEFVPLTTGLGVNLFVGNHEGADGMIGGELPGVGRFDTCYDYPAVVASLEAKLQRDLTHREASSWFAGQALEFVLADPGRALALAARKLRLTLGADEVSHNKVLVLEREHSAVLSRLPGPFPVYLTWALFGLGAWWAGRRRAARAGGDARRVPGDAAAGRGDRSTMEIGVLLVVSWLALALSLVPFFAAARYRVPLLPISVLFAAHALTSILGWGARRRWWCVALGVVALSLPAAWLRVSSARGNPDVAKWHCDRARSLRRAGDYGAADEEYRRALAVRPPRASVHYEYALLCMDRGDRAAAAAAYRRAIELDPGHMLAQYNLGTMLAEQGDKPQALAHLDRALRIEPRYAPAHLNIATLHLKAGEPRRALEACRRLLAFDPGNREARMLSARSFESLGELGQAADAYAGLLAEDPRSVPLRQQLAWILATAPQAEDRDGRRALELVGDLAGPQAGPGMLGTVAAALAEVGDFPRALEMAERGLALALEGDPGPRITILRSVVEACRAGRPVRSRP